MNICFRVDSSTSIGSGHVMRCLTLAEEMKSNEYNVVFLSRLHEGNLCNLIIEKGYEVLILKESINAGNTIGKLKHASWLGTSQGQDLKESERLIINSNWNFDWVIIDHYAIDISWEQGIRSIIPNVMVIDDIADREHDCDILLDQNYYQNSDKRYIDLVPKQCHLLLGPKYALLRDEFIEFHSITKRQKNTYEVLVFYGGSDLTNETMKALHAINNLNYPDFYIHVVVGSSNPNKELIKEYCSKHENFNFHFNIDYMAKLLHKVDFAICAGGSTTWERYCVGTPGIVTAVAFNQKRLCEDAEKLGIDRYIGIAEEVTVQTIENEINSIHMHGLTQKGLIGKRIVDGKGKKRVYNILNSLS